MKNNIFFYCYRLMEFKLFINSGILDYCTKYFNVIFLVPKDAVEECKKFTNSSITILASNYPSEKMLNKKKENNFFKTLENFFRNILALTYAQSSQYEKCMSQKFQIISYLNSQNNKQLIRMIRIKLVIFFAKLASSFFLIRRITQLIILLFLRNKSHEKLFAKYNPKLVIVGSMGLDADGLAIYEAKKNNVKSVVINQSWDRTVCKGYPMIHPDYLIVWNHHMKDEAHYYLEMPNQNIFVKGSPVWDFLIKKDKLITKKEFTQKLGLNPDNPIIYYPMSSSFWHKDLIVNIKSIIEAKNKKLLNDNIQIIFRVHPYYWRNHKLRKELFVVLNTLEKIDNFVVDYNSISNNSDSIFLNPDDQDFLVNCYNHSDLCVSVTSSAMVEMTISKKPSVNFIYGSWLTSQENILMKDYILHHLEKLYSYNIIKNIYTFESFIDEINNAKNNFVDEKKYNKFIEGELPIFRGSSAIEYAKCLNDIVSEFK